MLWSCSKHVHFNKHKCVVAWIVPPPLSQRLGPLRENNSVRRLLRSCWLLMRHRLASWRRLAFDAISSAHPPMCKDSEGGRDRSSAAPCARSSEDGSACRGLLGGAQNEIPTAAKPATGVASLGYSGGAARRASACFPGRRVSCQSWPLGVTGRGLEAPAAFRLRSSAASSAAGEKERNAQVLLESVLAHASWNPGCTWRDFRKLVRSQNVAQAFLPMQAFEHIPRMGRPISERIR